MAIRMHFALLALLVLAPAADAHEDCFLLIFGSQRTPNVPDYTHSFATFVRVIWPEDDQCQEIGTMEHLTISWLPVSGKVRTRALFPEPGANWGLHKTIRWCLSYQMRVSMWGAYRISPELYQLAESQLSLLQSGEVRYKTNDTFRSSRRVCNCIHALSGLVEGGRVRIASPGWGEVASYAVLQRYRRYIVDRDEVHTWVSSALGLDQYPIIYRDWEHPRSGALGGILRFFGLERDLRASFGPPVPSEFHPPVHVMETGSIIEDVPTPEVIEYEEPVLTTDDTPEM